MQPFHPTGHCPFKTAVAYLMSSSERSTMRQPTLLSCCCLPLWHRCSDPFARPIRYMVCRVRLHMCMDAHTNSICLPTLMKYMQLWESLRQAQHVSAISMQYPTGTSQPLFLVVALLINFTAAANVLAVPIQLRKNMFIVFREKLDETLLDILV